jgi:hypothetical protein
MRNNDFLEPEITLVANCHTCGEMVRFGLEKCANCGITLDQEEIFPSVIVNFVITQACSSANSIRTLDVGVLLFLGVSLMRYVIDYPLWFNLIASVFWLGPLVMILRWFHKHGRWNIADQEYEFAKKEMREGLRLWLAAHIFNAIIIFASWTSASGKAT